MIYCTHSRRDEFIPVGIDGSVIPKRFPLLRAVCSRLPHVRIERFLKQEIGLKGMQQ